MHQDFKILYQQSLARSRSSFELGQTVYDSTAKNNQTPVLSKAVCDKHRMRNRWYFCDFAQLCDKSQKFYSIEVLRKA